jgi:hypothetical protein
MKLLLENFKKSMKEQFRGPTDEPGFSHPDHNEPEGSDNAQDQAGAMVDMAVDGNPVNLNGDIITYDDPNSGGGGQFILNQSEVFAQDYDEAEEKIFNILSQALPQNELKDRIKESIKQKVMENLAAGQATMAQQRLKGAAGAAQKKMDNPAVEKAMGLATKRLSKAPDQQKVEFLLSIAQKLGIEPEEMQNLMARLKTTARKSVDSNETEVAEE